VNTAENPPQGALIDEGVTKGFNDFFIVSQKTTQGTNYYLFLTSLVILDLISFSFSPSSF